MDSMSGRVLTDDNESVSLMWQTDSNKQEFLKKIIRETQKTVKKTMRRKQPEIFSHIKHLWPKGCWLLIDLHLLYKLPPRLV